MWSLAIAIYAACKVLTWMRTPVEAPPWKHLGYLFGWPGLDAASFLATPPARPVPPPATREWLAASGKAALGIALLFGAVRLVPAAHPLIAGWIGMAGLVLTMHFGSFHLLSCAWRRAGVDAKPLMNAPLAAPSLSEFWGRRWNTAFRDLTHRFLFRPIGAKLGVRGAILAGFIASGLVHDLVISVPAGGGYGGPTIFFVVQGVAMLAERSPVARTIGLGHGLPGWAFAMAVLVGPVFLLFHPPFVREIMVPFLHAIGARG